MSYHLADNLPLDQKKETEVKKMYPRRPHLKVGESSGRKRPVFSGVVQTSDNAPVAQIALWAHESDNPKAPAFRGNITHPDGTKLRVSLWKRD